MKFSQIIARLPGWAVVAIAFAVAGTVAFLDYVTGSEVTVLLFYAAPIALAAWRLPWGWALGFAFVCAAFWAVANRDAGLYQTTGGFVWGAFTRWFYFVVVAGATHVLKVRQESDRERIASFERTRELEADIVHMSELEKQRIGQELHDGLCQFLAGTALAAHGVARKLESKGMPEAANVREIQGLIENAAGQAREIAHGVFPVQMGPEGLPAALDELVAATGRSLRSVKFRFSPHGKMFPLDPPVAMHFYRIAQEAISNAVRHARAQNVTVELEADFPGITLSVIDDGNGFDAKAREGDGIGLRSMTYRADLIGGRLEIKSRIPRGLQVSCIVPTIAPVRSEK